MINRTEVRIIQRLNIATGAWAEAHTPIRGVEQFGTKRNNFTENRGPAPNKPARTSYKSSVPKSPVTAPNTSAIVRNCPSSAHECPNPSNPRHSRFASMWVFITSNHMTSPRQRPYGS